MFYSYTRGEHKNMLGFPSTNKCSKVLVAISQSFVVEKRHGLCKSYSLKKRKKEKKRLRKNKQVFEI
jgi:hypothetical protein